MIRNALPNSQVLLTVCVDMIRIAYLNPEADLKERD